MNVVWLASYPKSGNTWVRFLFTNLLHGPFENSQTIFELTPVLERGIEPELLRDDRPNLVKTHHRLRADLPLLEKTSSAIYIVRNPFDVMMSNLNYFLLSHPPIGAMGQEEIDKLVNRYVGTYLQNGGDAGWRQTGYGSWREHVESWTENAFGVPVHVIRYEDLISDTAAELRKAADFASLDASDARIAEATERSSFTAMREMEEREIRDRVQGMFYVAARENGNKRGLRFMNKGKAGVGREALPPAMVEAARTVFSPFIDRLGYAT